MNARSYLANLSDSNLDFRADQGLVESSLSYQSEPFLINNMLVLNITNSYILTSTFTKKTHEALRVQSVYEIPPNKIKTSEDVYAFYEDSVQILNETYKTHRLTLPALPKKEFCAPPIEQYKKEIDRVLNLLNNRN